MVLVGVLVMAAVSAISGLGQADPMAQEPVAEDLDSGAAEDVESTAGAAEAEASASAAEEAEASESAAAEEQASESAAAEEQASASAEAEAEAEASASEEAASAEAARLDRASYTDISAREWEILARDPESRIGERYQIYGYVTQFDSFTGTDTFRANTGGDSADWYDHDTNTILVASNDPEILGDVVTDDTFEAYVEVLGAYDYDTTIGGTATAVLVSVNIIEVTGTTD